MKKRLLLSTCFLLTIGILANSAYAKTFSMQELNEMRLRVNRPLLTGDPNIDIQYLSEECNSGIQFSCTFLPSLRQKLQQRQQSQQGGYQNPRDQIITLPPLEDVEPAYNYRGNSDGIRQLPPGETIQRYWYPGARGIQQDDLSEMSRQRNETLQDEARAKRDAEDRQNMLNKAGRMHH